MKDGAMRGLSKAMLAKSFILLSTAPAQSSPKTFIVIQGSAGDASGTVDLAEEWDHLLTR